MGLLNKILPKQLKPISRDIGFTLNTIFYKIKNIGKESNPLPILSSEIKSQELLQLLHF